MDGSALVLVQRAGSGVVEVVLNRPEARNALSAGLAAALTSVLTDLAADPALRAVILTGAGDRAFCAGADLAERRTLSAAERAQHLTVIVGAVDAIANCPVPVIAAIRGYALAGGAELALACDVRIASTDAVLGFPEVRVGLFPGAGGVVRLPTLVGPGRARELLFTGRRILAAEARQIGLVNEAVDSADVLPEAHRIAREIAANAPLAIRALKQALRDAEGLPQREAHERVTSHRRTLDDTKDYAEGLSAFAERRSPAFRGE